jgi:hypothetical protein
MNRHSCFSNFCCDEKCESFLERNKSFYSSVFDVEMEIIFVLKSGGSDSYYDFILQASEVSASQMFLSSESEGETENENESRGSEKDEIGETLKLSGGSKVEAFSSFSGRKLGNVIRIEDSVEIVGEEDFNGDESLKEVIFSRLNELKEFCGEVPI